MCRYCGHLDVGLYSMAFDGMVRIVWYMKGVFFVIKYDYGCGFVIFSSSYSWPMIVSMARFMSNRWVHLFPSHFEDCAQSK